MLVLYDVAIYSQNGVKVIELKAFIQWKLFTLDICS